jgi:3-dehydroquinate synthase
MLAHPVFLFLRLMPSYPTLLRSTDDLTAFINERGYSRCIILTDSNTTEHCLLALTLSCEPLSEAEVIEVEPGEGSKSLEVAAGIWQSLLELGTDRNSCLICLGGGMVTDLGGFVASTFKRGIPYIYVPTSLLALVDASIGGKTGINLDTAKNQIGSFSWPDALYFSTAWLDTLPNREFMAGYAEMYKHALIADPQHLTALETAVHIGREALNTLIPASAEIKNTIVARDPHEKGERKILNFGHTAGHAFEALSLLSDQPLLHGEAVAAGMCVAIELSCKLRKFDRATATACTSHLMTHFEVMPYFQAYSAEQLWAIVQHDKKNDAGKVLFVLLDRIGAAVTDCHVSFDEFNQAFTNIAAR